MPRRKKPETLRIDDSELRRPIISPVCVYCVHLRSERRCAAFGQHAIPASIWEGDNWHMEPTPDQDNELTFTPAPDAHSMPHHLARAYETATGRKAPRLPAKFLRELKALVKAEGLTQDGAQGDAQAEDAEE